VTNRVGLFRDACLNLIGCLGHFKVTTYCSRERINNYELETPAGVCGASDPTRAGATAERAARCSATARFRGSGKSAGDSPDKPRANPAEQSSTAKDARGQWGAHRRRLTCRRALTRDTLGPCKEKPLPCPNHRNYSRQIPVGAGRMGLRRSIRLETQTFTLHDMAFPRLLCLSIGSWSSVPARDVSFGQRTV
jgi:hypothetical protein